MMASVKKDEGCTNISFNESKSEVSYIMSCDLGTSSIRCIIYNHKAMKISLSHDEIKLLCPKPGYVEIDPFELWEKFIRTIRKSLEDARLCASQIRCLGLSTQRATFLLWDKVSGEPLHNFITWKDLRADNLIKEWNESWFMKGMKLGTGFLYHVLRKKRFLAASILTFQNKQVNMRLKWVLDNDDKVKKVLNKGNLLFGTVDTWLIYKLTGGKVHATDPSNASGTAIYDPYLQQWSNFLFKMLNIPSSIFPEIRNSSDSFGETQAQLFGDPIPIMAVLSDQGAAMFGGCGFSHGDVKITLGTGAFFDLNTGQKPHTSINGIYPVVAWKTKDGIVYMAEGSSHNNGTIIQWGKDMSFYAHHADTSEMAESVRDTDGVYFIPSFQGLEAPINDAQATGGFLGLTINTRPEHIVRAMLESLAFRVYQIYRTMREEVSYDFLTISPASPLRVDGGVAQNDFLMQMIATLTGKTLERPDDIETSALGACFLAGLSAGVWQSKSEVDGLRKIERTFPPEPLKRKALMDQMATWEEALQRFTKWYPMKGTTNKSPS